VGGIGVEVCDGVGDGDKPIVGVGEGLIVFVTIGGHTVGQSARFEIKPGQSYEAEPTYLQPPTGGGQ